MAAEQVQAQTGHLISPKAAQSGSSCIPSCALRAGSRGGRGMRTVTQSNSELFLKGPAVHYILVEDLLLKLEGSVTSKWALNCGSWYSLFL